MSYPTEGTITVDLLRRRAVSGTVILSVRRVILQIIQTAATVVLARTLFPKTFGQFSILTFTVEFLALFIAQGLVSALVQAKGEMDEREISSIFWFILISSVVPFAVVWFGAPLLVHFLRGELEVGFYHLLAPAVFLVNLKLILSSILERNLKYIPLTAADILESAVYSAVAIFFVLRGFGLEALVYGYLSGKILAVLLLFLASEFKPKFVFASSVVKKLSAFAINYQSYSLVNSVSGAIAPIYVARVVGAEGTGYLSWAGGIGLLPWAFAELIGRVTFPLFSRVQTKKKLLSQTFERALDLNLMVVLPLSVIVFVFAEPITNIIFTYKWLPAVSALRYFVILGDVAAVNVIAQSALLALSEVKFVRNISLVSSFVFWILALILVPKIGFSGHPLAWFLGASVQLVFILKVKKILNVDFLPRLFTYLCISLISTLPVFLIFGSVENIFKLVFVLVLCVSTYILLILAFRREQIFYYLRSLKV